MNDSTNPVLDLVISEEEKSQTSKLQKRLAASMEKATSFRVPDGNGKWRPQDIRILAEVVAEVRGAAAALAEDLEALLKKHDSEDDTGDKEAV